jgi:Domain of unknown function (DUF1707)
VADQSDNLRASDADRQVVADQLRTALTEGRLDLTEYDERVKAAYAAKTYGDLKELLTDLPPVTPAARSQVERAAAGSVSAPGQGNTGKWVAGMWSGWLATGLIIVAIWFATSLAAGSLAYFWPHRQAERQARKAQERDRRRAIDREDRDHD